jgi:Uma2 family endonuclease
MIELKYKNSPMAAAHAEGLHLIYPESDGKPMAENTLQFEWIVLIKLGLEACFAQREDIFIAGDLLWYPVEFHPEITMAPDVLVALGRPRGHRGSYMQWREEGIAPQVVFEILSPGNRKKELDRKLEFYRKYGVEEYYTYNPKPNKFRAWQREGEQLVEIPEQELDNWTSPLLGIRLEWTAQTLHLYSPSGERFLSYMDLVKIGKITEQRAREMEQLAKAEQKRAAEAMQIAREEWLRAEEGMRRAEEEKQRADRLAAQLRRLGIEPDAE